MEVMVVLAILLVAGVGGVWAVNAMFNSSRVTAAADAVRAQLTLTRNRAMQDHRPYRFAIKENTGSYRIAPDTSEFWDDAPDEGTTATTNGPAPLQVEGNLPDKVLFRGGNSKSSGGWLTVAVFLGDGTAQDDVEINLAMEDNPQPVTLHLQAATGAVTTAALQMSSNEY
jgi:hypothetical protein